MDGMGWMDGWIMRMCFIGPTLLVFCWHQLLSLLVLMIANSQTNNSPPQKLKIAPMNHNNNKYNKYMYM